MLFNDQNGWCIEGLVHPKMKLLIANLHVALKWNCYCQPACCSL